VLTDMGRPHTNAVSFVLRAVAGSLGFFGLLRLAWVETHVVLPFTLVQSGLAARLFGTPLVPVEVTLACSGSDALALCLGAIVAYPARWRMRLAGAGCGVALIVGLNTLRIGSLGRVAASPAWFNVLHLYVWPAVLTLAIAGYVFTWMRFADRRLTSKDIDGQNREPREGPSAAGPQPSPRFVMLTIAFLLLFIAASPLYLASRSVLFLADFVAHAAAVILGGVGVTAHAAANVLWTPRGGFVVTQECITTPLIPVYLAAVCTYSATWRRLVLGVLATVPLFVALGILRLLIVALPDAVASPLFVVHAFYQLLLAAVLVFLAALWRHGRGAAFRHALAGIVVGLLFVQVLGPFYTRVMTYPVGTPLDDPQGAIAFLPAFQVGLYLALWVAAFAGVGWGWFLAGLAVLGLTQTAGLLALHALSGHAGLTAHVRDVRAWAVTAPLVIFAAVVHLARTRR
jgi:exosortase/archaeosortase family protein